MLRFRKHPQILMFFTTNIQYECLYYNEMALIFLTHQVDLSTDSIQLLLQLFGHDGYLASINDISHTVDLVTEPWRLMIIVGLRMQGSRGVELSHTIERKERWDSLG